MMRLHDFAKDSNASFATIGDEDLQVLHNALLVILDDLQHICEENNLHFVLIGGTAIGALRHQGFVPWDDDMDIAMPRKDFDELAEIIKSEYSDKYYLLNPADDNNYGRVIPKLGLEGTEYRTALSADMDKCGIFLDVFIIENMPDNGFIRSFQGIMAMFCGYALSCRRLYKRESAYENQDQNRRLKIKSRVGFLFSFATLERWAQWTDKWHSRCRDDSSKYISIPSDGKHFFGGIQKRSQFLNYKETVFEGRKCYLPGNYDEYLWGYYGDYMELPPPEKRERNKYIAFNPGKYGNI